MDRFPDVCQDLIAGKWRVRFVPTGGRYGVHNAAVNEGKPLVEFYDTTANPEFFGPFGQLVTRYYADTLLGRDGYSSDRYPKGLLLDADIPEWTVSPREMQSVIAYLKEHAAPGRHPPLGRTIADAETRVPEEQHTLPEPSTPDR